MTDLVDEVLNRLDIVSLTGIDKRGPHPIHGSESGINLSVNSTENNWFCFRHNVGGYAIHWIAIRDFGQTCDQAVQFVRNNFLTVVRRAFEIEGVEYSKKKIGQLPIREKKRYEVVDPDSYQFTFLKLRGKSKKKPGFPSTWSDYHETMYGIDLSTKQNRIILTGSFNLELYPLLIMDFDLVKGSEEIFNIDAFLGATKFQHSFMVKTPSRGVHVYYLLEKVDSFDDIPKSYTIEITDKMRKAYPYLQGLRQIDVQSKGKGAFAPPTEWTEGEVLGKYEVVGHHWLKVMNPDFLKKLEFAEVLDPGAVRSISQEPTRQKPLTAREVMNGVQQFLEDLRDEYPQFKVKNFDEVIYFDKSRGIHVIDEEDRFLNRRVAKFLKQHHQFQDLDTNHINEIVKKHKKSLLTGKIMDLDNFFKRSKFINPSTIVYCTETCIIKKN
ncbi:MAG: hypothetical protein IH840_17050, partial [Candidatus Heimdallarchaeota archaeon]|nr:hypothetical protein [Candidatus Heimdallarchaeota archaeon]